MTTSTTRKQYTTELKEEALTETGQSSWYNKSSSRTQCLSIQGLWGPVSHPKKVSTSKRKSGLATEDARLRRQLAEQAEELEILKKAATYFAKNQK